MNEPRFLLDAMLGNVARDLRLLGYDAAYVREGPDGAVLRQAQGEARILVTRDAGLAARAVGVRCVLLHEPDPQRQAVELLRTLRLPATATRPFCRCIACNGPLASVPAAEAWAAVPDHVAHSCRHFRRCRGCGRTYWDGTHRSRLAQRVSDLLGALQPPDPSL